MRIAIAATIVLGLASIAHAEEIREIVVEENKKTDDDTVALIARLEVGDDWNVDMIQTVTLRLEASGLFRDIRVFSEPHKSGSGVKVTIIVRDKHSWVIAPAFYTQPTNIGGGVGFGENNLFGKNQKLLLYGQIATQDSFFIGAWQIPNLGGTRWYAQVDTFIKSQLNIEYAAPREYLQTDPNAGANKEIRRSRLGYINGGLKLGIELFRGFKIDARLRGARVSYSDVELAEGATIEEAGGEDPDNPGKPRKPGLEGNDVSTEYTMSIDRKANYHGVQTGYRYGVSFENSSRALGSDFRYWYAGLNLFRGERIMSQHNIVLRGNVNYGYNMPFQQEFSAGGTGMRGWKNYQFRGNFRAIANLEYSVPFFTVKGFSVRLLAFWDSAYTTFLRTDNPQRNYLPFSQRDQLNDSSRFNEYLAPFKNSVGVGTRFYLKQIVLPLLGVDVGYGLEARDVQVYLAIGLTD